jgi:glutamate formiminotransferase
MIGSKIRSHVARKVPFMSPKWGTLRPVHGLIEAVPNFSVGSDGTTIDAIAGVIDDHARVLDVHSDADHNRSVFTCVGPPGALVDGLARAVEVAIDRIDLGTHVGVHPRVGAADVIPFVRFAPDDPAPPRAARALGGLIAEMGVPCFGYGELGEGRRPAFFRSGGPERLSERMAAGEIVPAFGPGQMHATAGAVLLGVRPPLVAFNIDLATEDGAIASEIAVAVRASSGGLPGVQAIGLVLASTGRAQVSMNLIDITATPLWRVVEEVRRLAEQRGAEVVGSELVGLMPASVAWASAARALQLPDSAADRVLEVAVAGEFGSA